MLILLLADPQGSKFEFEFVLKTTLVVLVVLVLIHLVIQIIRWKVGSRVKYRWSLAEKLIYVVFALCVASLGTTAFTSLLALSGMHGWWLLAHLVGAGGFVVVVTVMSWTVSFRFMPVGASTDESSQDLRRFPWPVKLLYWIVLMLCLPVVGTILLSMFPIFGTEQLVNLIEGHRFSGLALFSAVAVHCLLIVLPHR